MELNIQYFGFTGISTFLLRGTSKRCRPNVWGTFPSTSSLFVLMIFLAMTISAQSQSRCACSPSAIEFTFDFSGTCENNSIAGPGIADTNCSISPFASANVIDFVPSFLTTIDVIELGQNLQIVKQTTSSQDFFNGDTFRYESIVRDPDDLADAELPRAIEFSAVGRNRQNEQIFLIWIVSFSNDCQTFPVFSSPNQSIGWTILSSVTQPLFEFCPIVGTAAPTRSPAPIPQSSKDAPAPITQSAKDTPAPIVRMPTLVDNPAANPVVPPSLLHPTREPAVECLPTGKGSSKKSEKSGGKSGKGSSSGSKSSKSAKSAKGGECDETSGKSSKSSKSGKGKGNVFSRPPVISTSAPIEQGSGDGPEIPVSPPATSLPVTPPSGGNGGSGDGGSGDAFSSADDPVVGGTQDVDSQLVQLPINSAPEDTPSANEFPSDNDGSDSSGFPSTSVPIASSTSEKAGFRQNRIRSSLLIASGVGLVVVFLGLLVSRQWHARGSIDPFKPLLLSSNTSNAYHGATTVGTSSVSHVSTMEGHDVPSIYLTETGSSRYAD